LKKIRGLKGKQLLFLEGRKGNLAARQEGGPFSSEAKG